MLVFGHTAENLIVPTQIEVERVVATGIDPWRLDLLDRDPAAVETAQGELLFRKLDNFSVAYVDPDDKARMVVCLMRDGDCAAVCGTWRHDATDKIIREPRQSRKPFAYHLTRYLHLAEKSENSFDMPQSARMPDAVSFQGSDLRFGGPALSLSSKYLYFTGTMVEEVFATVQLDERVNWIFEKLQRWNPMVIGAAVHQSIRGEAPALIQMYLDHAGRLALCRSFKCYNELGGPLEFEREGCKYKVWDNKDWFNLNDYLLKQDEAYSTDWLYAVGKNRVTGTRIAFNDVASGITRPMHFTYALDSKLRQIRESQGLRVVDVDAFNAAFNGTQGQSGWQKFRGASVR